MRRAGPASLVMLLFIPSVAEALPAPPPAGCLRQDMVQGWMVVDDRTLIVTDWVGKTFTVLLTPGCRNLKFNQRLAFSAFSGTGLACLGRNDYVVVPPGGGDPSQRCLIAEVRAGAAPAANAPHS